MNILILSGSPRKGGNTELLAEAYTLGCSIKNGNTIRHRIVQNIPEFWRNQQLSVILHRKNI